MKGSGLGGIEAEDKGFAAEPSALMEHGLGRLDAQAEVAGLGVGQRLIEHRGRQDWLAGRVLRRPSRPLSPSVPPAEGATTERPGRGLAGGRAQKHRAGPGMQPASTFRP